jgi:hypothetical protein
MAVSNVLGKGSLLCFLNNFFLQFFQLLNRRVTVALLLGELCQGFDSLDALIASSLFVAATTNTQFEFLLALGNFRTRWPRLCSPCEELRAVYPEARSERRFKITTGTPSVTSK